MTFCVFVSHITSISSALELARRAPFGDQAIDVMSAMWPLLNDLCCAPSSTETTTMSRVAVAHANALPSGCHTHREVASASDSSLRMTPSIVLYIVGSSV